MRVALPSGHYAEFRDVLMRGDVRDARKGIVVVVSPDGTRTSDGSFLDSITGRLITRTMVAWDVGDGTLPSSCQTGDLAQAMLDGLDEADYEALEKAVGPWVERILRQGRADVFTHAVTGVKVTPLSAADGEKLAADPAWAREGEADPKPALTSTETSG